MHANFSQGIILDLFLPKISDNVPRVPEVGDQRESIWAEALVAVAGDSLLCDVHHLMKF